MIFLIHNRYIFRFLKLFLVKKNIPDAKKILIISDKNLPSSLLRKFIKSLKKYKPKIYKLSSNEKIKSFKVAYVGLTHLGLNYLAASSEKGFEIVGVDINQNKIDKLNQFKVDYNEPNLQRVILKNKKNIIFSSNLKNIKNCQVVYISKDVSTDKKGKVDFIRY